MIRLAILCTLAGTACTVDHCETYTTQTYLEAHGSATRSDGATNFDVITLLGDVDNNTGSIIVTSDWMGVSLGPVEAGAGVGFDPMPIAQALNDLHLDLMKVDPGTVLLGRQFTLAKTYTSYAWTDAKATMTAKVVPPKTSPAPLLTLDMHFSLTPVGGALETFTATQEVTIHSEQIAEQHCNFGD